MLPVRTKDALQVAFDSGIIALDKKGRQHLPVHPHDVKITFAKHCVWHVVGLEISHCRCVGPQFHIDWTA